MKIKVGKTDWGKEITVTGLCLQFDGDLISRKSPKKQVSEIIDLINGELQHTFSDLSPHIYSK